MQLDIKFEVQHGGLRFMAFLRSAIAKPFARAVVELRCDPIASPLFAYFDGSLAHSGLPPNDPPVNS